MKKNTITDEKSVFLDFLNNLNVVEFEKIFKDLGFALKLKAEPGLTPGIKRSIFKNFGYFEYQPKPGIKNQIFYTEGFDFYKIWDSLKEKITTEKVNLFGKDLSFKLKEGKIIFSQD